MPKSDARGEPAKKPDGERRSVDPRAASRFGNDWARRLLGARLQRSATASVSDGRAHEEQSATTKKKGALQLRDFTTAQLIEWALSQHVAEATVIARVHSHVFEGTAEERDNAAVALTLAFRDIPLDERRMRREEARLMVQEGQRQQREAKQAEVAARAEQTRRRRWLAGEGTIGDRVLKAPHGPHEDRAGVVSFQTYDAEGEIRTLQFADSAAYAAYIEQELAAIQRHCRDLQEEVFERYKLDRKDVDATLSAAAWYQRPGLALPGVNLGFSKLAIAHGVIAVKTAQFAIDAAKAASSELASRRGTPAGEGLNDARHKLLQATHSLHKMRLIRNSDHEVALGTLETVSAAGDVATMVLPAPVQIGIHTLKNASERGSRMHSDPNASFGVGDFTKEVAIDFLSAKAPGRLAGSRPGVARSFGVEAGVNQVANAAQANDISKLLEFNGTDLAFAAAGSRNSSRAPSYGNSQPLIHPADRPFATFPHRQTAPDYQPGVAFIGRDDDTPPSGVAARRRKEMDAAETKRVSEAADRAAREADLKRELQPRAGEITGKDLDNRERSSEPSVVVDPTLTGAPSGSDRLDPSGTDWAIEFRDGKQVSVGWGPGMQPKISPKTSAAFAAVSRAQARVVDGKIVEGAPTSVDQLHDVNPARMIDGTLQRPCFNCVNVAGAVESSMRGKPVSAMSARNSRKTVEHLGVEDSKFRGSGKRARDPDASAIVAAMQAAGPGSRALVRATSRVLPPGLDPDYPRGHLFHALNIDGKVHFVDFQHGMNRAVDVTQLEGFVFLLTKRGT